MNIPTLDDLMHLCEGEAAFGFTDHEVEGNGYRIFGYRYIADKEMWFRPFARECRGHTFNISTGELACLPMPKFFNLGENSFTQGMDITKARQVMPKLDGSLISTVLTSTGALRLKTKGTFTSEQARSAEAWLDAGQLAELHDLAVDGWTVNCEWVGPKNRIVVAYAEPELVVLNLRHRQTGEIQHAPLLHTLNSVPLIPPLSAAVVRRAEASEGIVAVMSDGELVKMKSDWYLERHRLLDMLASDRRWVELCLSGNADDIIPIVSEQPALLARFESVSAACADFMRWASNFVASFYGEHGHRERKDYALIAQQLDGAERELFPLLMRRFTSRDVDVADLGRRRMDSLIIPHIEDAP